MERPKTLLVRISYKDLGRTYSKVNSDSLSLDLIYETVNQFIAENKIEQFLDIEVKYQGSWRNVADVFGGTRQTNYMAENSNGDPVIQIRLMQIEQGEKQQKVLLEQWEKSVSMIQQKSNQIHRRVMRDADKLQQNTQIDLAIFYSEPLSEMRKEVSFLKQTQNMYKKLTENKEKIIRSGNIEVFVATTQNIRRALSRGIKILHFSCHGTRKEDRTKSYLQIEASESEKVGKLQIIQSRQLLEILKQYKTPKAVIFSVCYSSQVAKLIHDSFSFEGKHVATIGYQNQVYNHVCQQFAQKFYSKIFSGAELNQSIQQTPKDHQNIRIFCKSKKQVLINPEKIVEHDKMVQMENRAIQNTCASFRFPKAFLQRFVKQLMENKSSQLHLIGPIKAGKTLFVKKSLYYLWERYQIQKHIIDLRQEKGEGEGNHQISNILEFQCELQRQIELQNIQPNKQAGSQRKAEIKTSNKHSSKPKTKLQFLVIAIDHCDSMIRYQNKQFNKAIRDLGQKLNAKIVIISRYVNQKDQLYIQRHDLTQQYMKACKRIKQQAKDVKFCLDKLINQARQLNKFVFCSIQHLSVKFFSQVPLINLFPTSLYEPQFYDIDNSFRVNFKEKIDKTQSICEESVKILKYGLKSALNTQDDLLINNIRPIKLMYSIIGVQSIVAHFTGQMEGTMQQKKQGLRIQKIIYGLIDICLILLEASKQFFQNSKETIQIFITKATIFLLYVNQSLLESNLKIIKIIKQQIKNRYAEMHKQEQFQQQMQLMNFCRRLYTEKQQKLDIFDQQCQNYIQKVKLLQNQEVRISKLNQNDDQKDQNKLNYALLEIEQIRSLKLPLLRQLNLKLINFQEFQKSQENEIVKIKQIIDEFKFIDEKKSIFWRLYSNFKQEYLSVQFHYQVFQLYSKKSQTNKLQLLKKLNQWIHQCDRLQYHQLKAEIMNFKANMFNVFPIFISSPAKRLFRIETGFPDFIAQKASIFESFIIKFQPFTMHSVKKYKGFDLKIPVSVFITDVYQIQGENYRKQKYFSLESQSQISDSSEMIQFKQLQPFFPCQVAIFCGQHVSKIKKLNEITSSNSAMIFIDTSPLNLNDKLNYQQTLTMIANGLICKQFLYNFYANFCSFMFKDDQKFNNKREQIQNSFENAKMLAKLICLKKFKPCFKEIVQLCDRIQVIFNKQCQDKPLTIKNKSGLFKLDIQRLVFPLKLPILKSKSKSQKLKAIDVIDQNSEVGYTAQINTIMSEINTYLSQKRTQRNQIEKKTGGKYFILVARYHEEDVVLGVICDDVKRREILSVKDLSSQTQNKFDQNDNILGIMKLTSEKSIDEIESRISLAWQRQELLQKKSGKSLTRVIIFVTKQYPIFKNESTRLPGAKDIRISKNEGQNIVPIVFRKVFLSKMEQKKIDPVWKKQLADKLKAKIQQQQSLKDREIDQQKKHNTNIQFFDEILKKI